MPLDYIYSTDEIVELHLRTLVTWNDIVLRGPNKPPPELHVPIYNSVLNMVAHVKQPNIAIPGR